MVKTLGQAELDPETFSAIADLAYRESGLNLVPEKTLMVQSRLRHRLRALRIASFADYKQLICSDDGAGERRMMISALTTNVSHFFREPHHFDILSRDVLGHVRARAQTGEPVRIWSAGCSNGQEPYSIAMHVLNAAPDLAEADFRILATDIDPTVLAFAQAARYSARMLNGVATGDRRAYFRRDPGAQDETYIVKDQVRKMVVFRELNLLSDWPMKLHFDAIFCRNVVIYFDTETQAGLWPRFRQQLSDGGLFFLGHSERITSPDTLGFRLAGPTAYQIDPGARHARTSGRTGTGEF